MNETSWAILEHIRREPREELHRLVFADAIDDASNEPTALGYLIRLTSPERVSVSWPAGKWVLDEWDGSDDVLPDEIWRAYLDVLSGWKCLARPGVRVTFRRGLIEAVSLPATHWLEVADVVTACQPALERVTLTTWPYVMTMYAVFRRAGMGDSPGNVIARWKQAFETCWPGIVFELPVGVPLTAHSLAARVHVTEELLDDAGSDTVDQLWRAAPGVRTRPGSPPAFREGV